MADFAPAFEAMIQNEGGFRLSNTKGDRGGQTYAGIARTRWPNWHGWRDIDAGQTPDTSHVRQFYRDNFWERISGDEIEPQAVACAVFDFAVNAGAPIAVKLAQIVVGVIPDGSIGPKTLNALNAIEPGRFEDRYAIAKITRYRDIVTKDRSQGKFLLGWINRVLSSIPREAA